MFGYICKMYIICFKFFVQKEILESVHQNVHVKLWFMLFCLLPWTSFFFC